MNYILKPSLEHIALAKVTTTLWNQHDIRALIAKFIFPIAGTEKLEQWQKIEIRVIEKVLKLPQPKHLQDKILGLIKPIGLQIARWTEYHCTNESYFNVSLPNEFSWTPQGTIDAKKTAEIIVKNKDIDMSKRLRLACYYCLPTDMKEIWKKMPQVIKLSFYMAEHPAFVDTLVCLVIKAKMRRMPRLQRRLNQSAFESAACYHYTTAAVEYFFQKMTLREKEESIIDIAEHIAEQRQKYCIDTECTEVLCFLLSQMNEEQQTEVFKKCSFPVLKCLLDWPWQGFFLGTANRMWKFLPESAFDCALREIINSTTKGFTDFNYRKIFQEFWQQSPDTHKSYITEKHSVAALLFKLLQIKDEKNIKMIIKDTSVIDKKKLIFSKRGQNICDEMIYCEEWDLVNFIIQECISSKNEIIQFKKEFKKNLVLGCSQYERPKNKRGWDKFFDLLDNIACSYDKRKCAEESDSCSPKKFHNMKLRKKK